MIRVENNKIYKPAVILFWISVFVILFYFLQTYYKYHFFYIEQNRLFLLNWAFIKDMLIYPGGFCRFVSGFLLQFYAYAYAGAFITTALSTCIGLLIYRIITKITSVTIVPVLFLVPMVISIFPHLDVNNYLEGTIAYILMLLSILACLKITNYKYRFIFSIISVMVLFWLAGSIVSLFSVIILIHQLLTDFRHSYLYVITVVCTAAIIYSSVLLSYTGSMRSTFLPDMYYHHLLPASPILYWQWITTLFAIFFACLLRPVRKKPSNIVHILLIILQIVAALVVWRVCLIKYGNYKSIAYKKIDYLVRNEQWDKIIDENKGKITNALLLCNLNMALANKNELAEKMFQFDQKGIGGLLINWDYTQQTAYLLSDLYFTTGNIAASQQIAFEGYVISESGNPRLLKRLVQTNLIMGSYAVAEKYIKLLEQTLYYRDWAKKHRKFLYNDNAVESDPLLGMKRKSVLSKDYLYNSVNIVEELTDLAENNPGYTVPIQYLGAIYLLAKDLVPFKKMLDKYYGTDVLPHLPQSFQEAVLLMSGNNADMPSTKYEHTYWFYYFFK